MERNVKPSPEEFGQALEVYGKVLKRCKVSDKDIQRQISEIQKPTVPEERVVGFINLTRQLQTAPTKTI